MSEPSLSPVHPLPINLSVRIEGVAMPSWVALCLSISAILATVGMLLMWSTSKEMTREIRVLQLHTQDVESVLIEKDLAARQDFAPWGPDAPTHDVNRKED